MKKFWFALAGLAVLATAGIGRARVEADPNKEYAVTAADGEWMILVASYHGEGAAQTAHNLVVELRARYDLPGFVFDRSAVERAERQKEIEEQRRQTQQWMQSHGYVTDQAIPVRVPRIEEKRAVLIGGYPDMVTARRALDKMRDLPPPQSAPGDSLVVHCMGQGSNQDTQAVRSPFRGAFVVRNPVLPAAPPPVEDDPFVRRLNAGESLSISQCRKPWTLAVASFQGLAALQTNDKPKSIFSGLLGSGDGGDRLSACAVNAHNLAELLRKMHYEAYVYHTRYRSVVTVGGFDSKDDPRLEDVKQAFMKFQYGPPQRDPTKPPPPPPPGVFAQPLPMEVPKL
jgi:hypothetical protein